MGRWRVLSRDFCFWLQGFLEVAEPDTLTAKQLGVIKSHLSLVFIHEIDPSFPAEQQEKLNAAHKPKPVPMPKPIPHDGPLGPLMRC